jgi:DNA modification methylase
MTPKPVGLIEKIISKTDGIIVDYFLGSGTTLIACERLGRKCRAVEIEPKYVAVTLQRWADATGREPELIL